MIGTVVDDPGPGRQLGEENVSSRGSALTTVPGTLGALGLLLSRGAMRAVCCLVLDGVLVLLLPRVLIQVGGLG